MKNILSVVIIEKKLQKIRQNF